MHFSKLYKVKGDKLEILKNWFKVLSDERKEEAIATFAYENVSREVFALFTGHDGCYYVIGLNEVTDTLKKGDPEVTINQEHRKILEECLEPISDNGSILLDLKV